MDVPLETATVERGVTYRYFPRQAHTYTFSPLPMAKWLWSNVGNYDIRTHSRRFHIRLDRGCLDRAGQGGSIRCSAARDIETNGECKNRRRVAKKISFWAVERGILDHAALIHYTCEQGASGGGKGGGPAPTRLSSPIRLILNDVTGAHAQASFGAAIRSSGTAG